jgi:cholera enterotoxin subunit A
MLKAIFLFLFLFSAALYAVPPHAVFRASMDAPDFVKQTGGFLARGMDGTRPNQPPPNISLFNHVSDTGTGVGRHDSGYVSTTTSLVLAHTWVNTNNSGRGYIYFIRPTGNFIDVNGTLGRYSPFASELEYAAMGMIRWQQILGWREVSFGILGEFVDNNDYNPVLYGSSHAGGIEPQLAGFPQGHIAWTQEPWNNFQNCMEHRKKRSQEEGYCVINESSQQVGEEYYRKYWGRLVMKILLVSS